MQFSNNLYKRYDKVLDPNKSIYFLGSDLSVQEIADAVRLIVEECFEHLTSEKLSNWTHTGHKKDIRTVLMHFMNKLTNCTYDDISQFFGLSSRISVLYNLEKYKKLISVGDLGMLEINETVLDYFHKHGGIFVDKQKLQSYVCDSSNQGGTEVPEQGPVGV